MPGRRISQSAGLRAGCFCREARALAVLDGISGVPELISVNHEVLERSYIAGQPMQVGKPTDPDYFKTAARLLRRHHRLNVVHNDLAKEPNFILTDIGRPAIIDYQLAWHAPGRGRLFRVLAREDIRHLLKHKRTYCAHFLTAREKRILANPSPIARIWSQTGKRLYLFCHPANTRMARSGRRRRPVLARQRLVEPAVTVMMRLGAEQPDGEDNCRTAINTTWSIRTSPWKSEIRHSSIVTGRGHLCPHARRLVGNTPLVSQRSRARPRVRKNGNTTRLLPKDRHANPGSGENRALAFCVILATRIAEETGRNCCRHPPKSCAQE